jgi:hypothetical protein
VEDWCFPEKLLGFMADFLAFDNKEQSGSAGS